MKNLSRLAKNIRIHALKMTSLGKSSHIGSIFSICDILAVLYGDILNFNAEDPKMQDRDRFILSKGHAGAGVYAVLAESNFFNVKELKKHYQNGTIFSGHISHKGVPGVEFSTGSLGHGLGVGAGIAKAAKRKKEKFKVYVLMSDGECDEGSNWEAILFSSHHKLGNLVAIIDYNKIQSLDTTYKTLNLEPFAEKWKAFGWEVIEIDGHNILEIKNALIKANHIDDQPTVIICHTIKGKGVSFMENSVLWHYRSPQNEEYSAAIQELNGKD